ncbi:MAG: NADH-quinone oxidoreductase subunit C [Actinobacteria bacterium]|jgi:Ni,Fe-hydrogenase III large subunit/Ni,Fe-hydrogenase III component G|nr:NADH-quinone oxidoreductase subunit C [Actinomycetota bacterium]
MSIEIPNAEGENIVILESFASHEVGAHRSARAVEVGELRAQAAELLAAGFRLALVSGHDDGLTLRVVYLFLAGGPDQRRELTVTLPAAEPVLPSLAELSVPASRFERELHDLFGIIPVGHPMPRRLVRHAHWPAGWYPMRRDAGPPPEFVDAERFPFLTVEGEGVYEIPVGPVHAGMIGPGHFRFSVVGETILRLKARLWFTHRGVEKLFEGLDPVASGRSVELAAAIAGDTSVGHTLAHCLAVEDALGLAMPAGAQRLRAMLLELERLYHHASDIGALANDVGFGLANSHAGRIREELLRINDAVTGHRLLRGAIGVGRISVRALPDLVRLRALADDLADVARQTLAKSMVYERFSGTAVLALRDAVDLGCLGPAARASGVAVDARVDHPFADLAVAPVLGEGGDVLARFTVRRDEFAQSVELVERLVAEAGPLSYAADVPADGVRGGDARAAGAEDDARSTASDVRGGAASGVLSAARSGVGIVEAWRGTVVHRVELDAAGRLLRAKVVDPSWFNWPAVPVSLTDTIVPDFPLVNKSFNLSYPGNDL